MTRIGDTLYCHGRIGHKEWSSSTVCGETTQSYHLGNSYNPTKINKKTLVEADRQYGNVQWFTEQGMLEAKWRDKNARNIATAVGGASNESLRKIAEIIGFKTEEGE